MMSQEDDDDDRVQPRYNLRSRANLSNHAIDPTLIPGIKINSPERRYAHGYTAANHALQLWQLSTTMQKNFPDENFASAVLEDETGKSLEFHHLIKIDKYRTILMKSFANELGRLAQVFVVSKGPILSTSSPSATFLRAKLSRMVELFAHISPKRMKNTARALLSAATSLYACLMSAPRRLT